MKVGLDLPTWTTDAEGDNARWIDVLRVADAAVSVGFDSLWVPDHMLLDSAEAELRRRAGAELVEDAGDAPEGFLECFSIIAALASEFPTVELGSLVACSGFRNPALTAKVAATIDEISGGRFILGIGAGDSEAELTTFGFLSDHPVSRFEEALIIIRGLLHHREFDFQGSFYQVRNARLRPRSPRPSGPPILIGTLNPRPRMQRLVAQYADIWNAWLAYGDSWPGSLGLQQQIIDHACHEHGRDPKTLERTAGVSVLLPGSDLRPAQGEKPLSGPPEEIAQALLGHFRAGLTHVQVILSPTTPDAVRAFGSVLDALDSA
jgi:alkanesulfonate monooxygenase SsuD/methylene tetrahydromethanopterin reductase-like flavin-dependent oxidoreductase (luciferase family)